MNTAQVDKIAATAKALGHPTRVRIVASMMDGRVVSPVQLSAELQEPIGNVAYQVRTLVEAGVLELAGTTPRRGAVRHDYRIAAEAKKQLKPFLRA